jgi:hypothetical protein
VNQACEKPGVDENQMKSQKSKAAWCEEYWV